MSELDNFIHFRARASASTQRVDEDDDDDDDARGGVENVRTHPFVSAAQFLGAHRGR